MSARNATLDIAKGLGIVLVVLGHNWIVESTKGELFRIVFSFHMPLFFFLSGVFIRADDAWARFVAARAHALLKPYVVVLAAIGLLKMGGIDYWLGLLYGTGRTLYWIPMWFLPHLFTASLATLLVLKVLPSARAQWVAMAVALVFGVWLMRQVAPADWPWSLDLLPLSLAFLLLGHRCRDAVLAFEFDATRCALAAAAFAALHVFFDQTIDVNIRLYGTLPIATAQALLGIYLTLAAAAWLGRFGGARRVLATIGSATLFILVFHIYAQWKTFNLLTAAGVAPAAAWPLALVAGVALPLLVWQVCRRVPPLAALLLPPATRPEAARG
jgi:polysaccharide biosynthesis protein PslL